jgi:hypothetical protein
MGNIASPSGDVVRPVLTQWSATMSSNPSRHLVCRLLGGSGRRRLALVSTRKLPALCVASGRPPVDSVVTSLALPLAA